ncbi:MAG: 3-deoxy-7-phosphoheptulonate synthase [Buchnera aphidicola (Periphyllus lyropictus)]|uniref:3-deoxy-7-phosphoheptulonate synthase n=1 Tax=Buchnera aphidicola TaxID=9 RepID=UPI001EB289FF|nr:3-deoxy-7-phosphoheptulonate synthase [Buchnera aphidicola]NIH16713.1 3-deoxy-7-phosphoheptulonate synthase [Buchnera aphidicola (Periphyllus lyropictus)]USS94618.1 3-deoxy-7-phosphoheptulonate synthase [Buchnera aphidicola (Periphyllus lyropictus)]
MHKTNELRMLKIDSLITPSILFDRYPMAPEVFNNIVNTKLNISDMFFKKSNRLLVVVGPCSIHDPIAAMDYAVRLNELRIKHFSYLEIVMRTYFEKPRTVVGWKGLVSDPELNNTFKVNLGLDLARKLLLDVNKIGLPTATEFLDPVVCQFLNDLISWGAIGARTTESHTHRELASSLSCPIGFKNGTDGNLLIAIDAMRASKGNHVFLSLDKNGSMVVNFTLGNYLSHLILRGGKKPNYHKKDIDFAISILKKFKLQERVMIDFSHGNSLKQHKLQLSVCESVCKQIHDGSDNIFGVMIESFLEEGSQPIKEKNKMKYGQSVTDSCLNWDDTVLIIEKLSKVIKNRS